MVSSHPMGCNPGDLRHPENVRDYSPSPGNRNGLMELRA
ncbi:hypothetical protein EC2854350_4264 [Escherichia coli 2854350]|nr:hypothetical protein EC2854350_4264 [Escherichia coli 2854350]